MRGETVLRGHVRCCVLFVQNCAEEPEPYPMLCHDMTASRLYGLYAFDDHERSFVSLHLTS